MSPRGAHLEARTGPDVPACPPCNVRQSAGQKLQIQALGLVSIADDVSPELARATIDSIIVLGGLRAGAKVKAALAGRIQ